jgi:BA14K-like protein
MFYRKTAIALAAALALATTAAGPAMAAHWGHHGGWGAGVVGFAAGATIGSALAAPSYYYGYGGPYYDSYGYDYDDGPYAAAPAYSDGDAYCAQRYRSYDPATGTYLGYDGIRHPCR